MERRVLFDLNTVKDQNIEGILHMERHENSEVVSVGSILIHLR